MEEKRSVVLVGAEFAGTSIAYALMNTKNIDKLILIDIDDKKEDKMLNISNDLSHMKIFAGTYHDCVNADIVVIMAGASPKPKQTQLELASVNTHIIKDITKNIMQSGFDGIMIVASQPVDIMTYVVQKVSGLPSSKVIGMGTLVDTERLRLKLSQVLKITPRNVHTYILGKQGDSAFVSWSNTYIGCMKIKDFLDDHGISECVLEKTYKEINETTYKANERTADSIGLLLNRLIRAILDDENAIVTVSCKQNGEYVDDSVYMSVPAVINRHGVKEIIKLRLEDNEFYKFEKSCHQLLEIIETMIQPII